MSHATKAVFLSYASQDAEAARKICEALRDAGVEVWFDQNELVGGDAWDQKIREQIKACALFVPVISAETQARREGYFRREWKQAAARTHDMADGTPFLLPVVIDATRDAEALVPEEFRAVQWTRLPGGDTRAAFCERVKILLGLDDQDSSLPRQARNTELVEHAKRPTVADTPNRGRFEQKFLPSNRARRMAAAMALAVAFGALVLWQPWKSFAPPDPKSTTQPPKPLDAASAKSIAVLPFANLSEDKDANAFFADGMHDELLSALAKIGALKVISRTSVLAYRDPAKQRNLKQIAAELGVAHILEGSVSRSGMSVRIIVQLIDAATDAHRWADTYNLKEVTDVFQVQSDIAAKIASSLAATISPGEKRALAQKLTSNPAAYDLYLAGRRWRELDRSELNTTAKWEEQIISPLEKAVALDPKFAAAHAELGQVHGELYWWGNLDPSAERLARAKDAIDTALRLDPALPTAHLALGTYYYRGFLDYPRATEEYAVALAAMPGDAELLFHLSSTQRRQGRWLEAAANQERAFAIDPQHQTYGSAWIGTLLIQRLYRQAETAADRVLAANRRSSDITVRLKARARFARDGDVARYRTVLAENRDPNVNSRYLDFSEAFLAGRYAEAARIYDETPEEFFRRRGEQSDGTRAQYSYFFAATVVGDRDKVRARALAAIAETRDAAEERRDEWQRVARLALLHAFAGQPGEARRLAEQTLALMPIKRDAFDGMRALNEIAQVYLALGDHDRALALLDQAMSVPNDRSANEILHFEPWWKPLHHDPRFKAALAKAAPQE